jgi:hypothetical protein
MTQFASKQLTGRMPAWKLVSVLLLRIASLATSKINCFRPVGNGTVTLKKKSDQIVAGNYHSEVCVLGHVVIMVYHVSENKILGI